MIIFFLFVIQWGCKAVSEVDDENPEEIPQVKPEWIEWIKENHSGIRTLDAGDSDFSDLQFLKGYIGNRRLVQLGESSHGVSEYSKAKVRLIKFLHQQMGFDVIAFESGLFDCFMADHEAHDLDAEEMMKRSIYGVWHCGEVLELFKYIQASKDTANPLILTGFDVKFRSDGFMSKRPRVLKELIEPIDPDYAEEVFAEDEYCWPRINYRAWRDRNGEDFKEFYRELYTWMDTHMEALIGFSKKNPLLPLAVRQSIWSMIPLINYVNTMYGSVTEHYTHRDKGMAENVGALLNDIYPEKKIMIWAHNYHIQHDAGAIAHYNFRGVQNMGYCLAQNFRDQMYTIGLYMYGGYARDHYSGEIYEIACPPSNSMDAILFYTEKDFSFVDLMSQVYQPGNSWMFEKTLYRYAARLNLYMVPRDQFDAILFIKTAHIPHYID